MLQMKFLPVFIPGVLIGALATHLVDGSQAAAPAMAPTSVPAVSAPSPVPVAAASPPAAAAQTCAQPVGTSIAPETGRSDGSHQASNDPPVNLDQLDPQQRGDAIEAIAAEGGEHAREVIAHALADPDESIRRRALEQTQRVQGLALPTDTLQTMLQQDASETVRLKALDLLATDPRIDAATLAAIAQRAGSDPSELVRAQALGLSQRLEVASRSQGQ